MTEQIEVGKKDHNILAVRTGDSCELTPAIQDKLRDFVLNVFADIRGKSMRVGRFLGKQEALDLIVASPK
jgi:hypothetical protein